MAERSGSRGTIVYIGNFELPDGNAAAQRVRGNARIFRDLGFRVLLVGISGAMRGGNFMEPVGSGDEGIAGYQIAYPAGTIDWMRRIGSSRMLKAVIELAEIRDLVMTICYNYPAVAQYRIAAETRKHGALAIADCTEWYGQVKNDSLASVVKNIDSPLRMRVINRRMDGLITTSPFISEFYRPTGLPIVELPTIVPLTQPVTLAAENTSPRKRLFFAGTGFNPALALKGKEGLKDRLDWVLEMLHSAKQNGAQFSLDLFGVTKADYLTLVPSHATILADLAADLKFHGRVPHSELLDTLIAADFSIFMRKETRVTKAGFPSKFSESISFGTPVIATGSVSMERYLVEGENGFRIDYTQFETSAAKLTSILQMSAADVRSMKRHCLDSKMFAHSAFIDPVARWLATLSLPLSRQSDATLMRC